MPTGSQSLTHAQGYVIRQFRLTETSLIVEWLTANEGRVPTVARGALKRKSPLFGKLDVLFFANLTFQRSRRSDLHPLREVELLHAPDAFRRSFQLLTQVAYFVELIRKTTEIDTPIPEIFDLFQQSLGFAERGHHGARFTLWFEWRLLDLLGLQPDPSSIGLSDHSQEALEKWNSEAGAKVAEEDLGRLGSFLAASWIQEIGRCPTNRDRLITP